MKRPRPGVGSELLLIGMILAVMALTLGLVIEMHRRSVVTKLTIAPAPVTAEPPKNVVPPKVIKRKTKPIPPPVVIPAVRPPVEDPTKKVLAQLGSEVADQLKAVRLADKKAEALEVARQAAVAEIERWKRREMLVRNQADSLNEKASRLEAQADALELQRDVLARERDATKAAVSKASSVDGGYAVLPHKGASGTWQRPVIVECKNGMAILQPKGLAIPSSDLSPLLGPRASPLVAAVGRELIRAYKTTAPDGSGVIPYIYFIVRPDGIRAYYEARTRLEPLGIAFGYELVDQDWEIEFPDFDELESWDATGVSRPKPKPSSADGGPLADGSDYVWPSERPGNTSRSTRNRDQQVGNSPTGGSSDDPNSFMWPRGTPSSVAIDADDPGEAAPGTEDLERLTRERFNRNGTAGILDSIDANRRNLLGGLGPRTNGVPGFGPGTDRLGATRNQSRGTGSTGQRRRSVGSTGAPSGPQSDVPTGLIPVDPETLLGLDSIAGSVSSSGSDSKPIPGRRPGARIPSSDDGPDPVDLGRVADAARTDTLGNSLPSRVLPSPGDGSQASSNPLPHAIPGRVRIDRSLLARAVNEDWEERPPEFPRGAISGVGRTPVSAGSPASNPSASTDSPGSSSGSFKASNSSQTGTDASSGNGSRTSIPTQPTLGSGAHSANGGASGIGIPTFGANSSAGSQESKDTHPKPTSGDPWPIRRPRTIEAPLDLVVACEPNGVVIHPGGYRLSRSALSKNGTLADDLKTIVRNHELIDSNVRLRPRVEFLIEPGGTDTYQLVRKQTVLSGLSWPVTIRVAESSAPQIFPKERF